MSLTHLGPDGRPEMVDVSDKVATVREATAIGTIRMGRTAYDLVAEGAVAKGNVLSIAELAGIMAAKDTSRLIPLCHQVPLSKISLEAKLDPTTPGVTITATARCVAQTGVEMEALTAVAVACLTVYDMVKSADRGMVIEGIKLLSKSGGRSGDFSATSSLSGE